MKLKEMEPGTPFRALTVLTVVEPVGRVKQFVEANPGWSLVMNMSDNSVFLMKDETEVEIAN